MTRTSIRLSSALLASLALAAVACANPPAIVGTAQAASPDAPKPGVITVTGSATLDVVPDVADVAMTLTTQAARPKAAVAALRGKQA